MQIGETVVLVQDLDGMPAAKEGRVMRVRGDMRLIGCRAAPRNGCGNCSRSSIATNDYSF